MQPHFPVDSDTALPKLQKQRNMRIHREAFSVVKGNTFLPTKATHVTCMFAAFVQAFLGRESHKWIKRDWCHELSAQQKKELQGRRFLSPNCMGKKLQLANSSILLNSCELSMFPMLLWNTGSGKMHLHPSFPPKWLLSLMLGLIWCLDTWCGPYSVKMTNIE